MRAFLKRGCEPVFLLGLGVLCGCFEKPTESRDPAVDQPNGRLWFRDITSEVGLSFIHESGAQGARYIPEIMGGGGALFDFDKDGDLDIFLTSGNDRLPGASSGEIVYNRLYRQEPDGRFVDGTAGSGLDGGGYGKGVATGDIDNDGWVDLYVTNYGPDRLYKNTSTGTFRDITEAAGISGVGWSTSAVFCDYDLDGFLDLYVARYVDFDPGVTSFDPAGRPEYPGPRSFAPVSDLLFHNNGDDTFSEVSEVAGVSSIRAAGLGVVCEDLNSDGLPDFYVANDAYANQLWMNQGHGTFRDEALRMGVAFNLHGQAEAGMGVVAGDLDNDGDLDLFLTHLAVETNTFYRNLGGEAGFRDDTGQSGLGSTSMVYTGFGTAAFDADLDGDLDLAVANGRVKHGKVLPGVSMEPPWDVYSEPNLFYLNDGSGQFKLAGEAARSFTAPVEITRGLATGDIDSDGDLDLLVSTIQGKARFYRNDIPGKGHWLQVQAVDPRLKRDAIGARVTVHLVGQRLVRTIGSGGSYLSSSEPVAHFGLGPGQEIEGIEVTWPNGLHEWFQGPSADQRITIHRASGKRIHE